MSLHDKLQKIQQELEAPKSQYNDFGGYSYRSCEDILKSVKPLLDDTDTTLRLSDELIEVGGKVYVKATVKITDWEDTIEATANAREAQNKKGMDDSQMTGTASSYARKYALNGLFAIDDVKDSDATNKHNSKKRNSKSKDDDKDRLNNLNKTPKGKKKTIKELVSSKYDDGEKAVKDLRKKYKVSKKVAKKVREEVEKK